MSTEIATAQPASINFYSSLGAESREAKMATLKAITNAVPLAEHLGETLNLVHFVIEPAKVNEDDGSQKDVARVILLTEDGRAFFSLAGGVMSSLRTFVAVMGEPGSWGEPLPVVGVEEKFGKNRIIKLQLA